MHLILVDHKGGLSLPRNSAVRFNDHPDMTIAVHLGCKATNQQQSKIWDCLEEKKIPNSRITKRTDSKII